MSQRGIRIGNICEDTAVGFLKECGYKILERNYRTPLGEIDVIAKDGNAIVFIEVKSRSSSLFGPPCLRITKKKKRHIINTALSYLKRYKLIDNESRIDIVSISLDKEDGGIELIKNAFLV